MTDEQMKQKQFEKIKVILDSYNYDGDTTKLAKHIYFSVVFPLLSVICTLKTDAEMAMSGEWDCTTEEGIETGFGAQIELIDQVL